MADACENCGQRLYKAKLGNQCIHCGHRTLSFMVRAIDRLISFVGVNLLLWLIIAPELAVVDMRVGLIATALTAFCLFGGLILRLWLKAAGEWIAVGLTVIVALSIILLAGAS